MREGWQVRKLAELVVAQNGYAFSSSEYAQTGHFVMRIGNVQNGYISTADPKYIRLPVDGSLNRFVLSEGDILVSLTGNVGRVGVIKDEHLPAALNQRVAKISIRNNSPATKEFLLLFLGSDWFREELTGAGHGAAQQNVSTKDLLEIEVAVPPLPEQQRIVALLDEAFACLATAKANAERNLQNARALFESHLQSVFSQRGEGWVEHTLGDLIHIQNGYAFKSTDYTETGFFVIRISNVQDGEITLANPRFIKLADKKHERFILNGGDILISLTGNIGRVGIIQEDQLPAVLNQRVARITIKDNNADCNFLFRFLLSRTFRESLQEAGHGAAQQNVSTKEIESVQISLPDKKEQRCIVEEFDSFAVETQRLTRLYERKLAALEELKKSLLHQAFNGEL
jgi:type I restriction enzyme S subunit